MHNGHNMPINPIRFVMNHVYGRRDQEERNKKREEMLNQEIRMKELKKGDRREDKEFRIGQKEEQKRGVKNENCVIDNSIANRSEKYRSRFEQKNCQNYQDENNFGSFFKSSNKKKKQQKYPLEKFSERKQQQDSFSSSAICRNNYVDQGNQDNQDQDDYDFLDEYVFKKTQKIQKTQKTQSKYEKMQVYQHQQYDHKKSVQQSYHKYNKNYDAWSDRTISIKKSSRQKQKQKQQLESFQQNEDDQDFDKYLQSLTYSNNFNSNNNRIYSGKKQDTKQKSQKKRFLSPLKTNNKLLKRTFSSAEKFNKNKSYIQDIFLDDYFVQTTPYKEKITQNIQTLQRTQTNSGKKLRKNKLYIEDSPPRKSFFCQKQQQTNFQQGRKSYYKPKRLKKILEQQQTCAICIDTIAQRARLACRHSFCKQCLLQWVQKKPHCPTCRQESKFYYYNDERFQIEIKEEDEQEEQGEEQSDYGLSYVCENCDQTLQGDRLLICQRCLGKASHIWCDPPLYGIQPAAHRNWYCNFCRRRPHEWYRERRDH